jgi:hypothetical protein
VATSRECVDPLPHDTSAFPAWFSGDGKRLLTVSGGRAQFHDLWDLGGPAPSWLPDLGEAIGGFALNDNGVVVPLENRVRILDRIREIVAAGSDDDSHIKWARWFFEDRHTRNPSPFSQGRPVEAVSEKAMRDTIATSLLASRQRRPQTLSSFISGDFDSLEDKGIGALIKRPEGIRARRAQAKAKQ